MVLLNDERHEPYEKPPLSKAVLIGKVMPHDAPIAGPQGVSGSGVGLRLGTDGEGDHRARVDVMTEAGERIGYDALVLATGSINRVLAMFPPGGAAASITCAPRRRRWHSRRICIRAGRSWSSAAD